METTKKCAGCGIWKVLEDFYRQKKGRLGRQDRCRTCQSAYSKNWRADNREREAATGAAWYAANKERRLEVSRAWWAANTERMADYRAEYNERNREAISARSRRQRELNRSRWENEDPYADPSLKGCTTPRGCGLYLPRENFYRLYSESDGLQKLCKSCAIIKARNDRGADRKARWSENPICYLCGEHIDFEDLHLDHMISRHDGGSDSASNLAPTHSVCNLKKGRRSWPFEGA